jgi:hypothetical protein
LISIFLTKITQRKLSQSREGAKGKLGKMIPKCSCPEILLPVLFEANYLVECFFRRWLGMSSTDTMLS